MLLGLTRIEDQPCAGRARDLDQLSNCRPRLLRPAVGDHRRDQSRSRLHRHRLHHGRGRLQIRDGALAGRLGEPYERLAVALRPGQA